MLNIAEKCRMGLPLDNVTVIDCHAHMGYWHNFNAPMNSMEGMLKSMDSLGIDMACITAHSSIGPDYPYGNDMVIKAVLDHPERFAGYVTVNPNYPKEMKAELDRCFAVKGIVGIKLHPESHGCPVDYANYRVAYETACEKKCPVLVHVWGTDAVACIEKLSDQYPEAAFIMGHSGGEIRAMENAIDLVNRRHNVYMDLALSKTYEGNVEWFVKEVGSKKILFATDMPFFDPRPAFGRVALAGLKEEEIRDVFGMNMKTLILRIGH